MAKTVEQVVYEIQVSLQRAIVQIAAENYPDAMECQLTSQDFAHLLGASAMSAVVNIISPEEAVDRDELASLGEAIVAGVEVKLAMLQDDNDGQDLIVVDDSAPIQ